MDLRNVWGAYERFYYRYNWHGDASALVDVNGNGDGWNNVSPFGDNGNGAYPANPNLEQYYGYGGAWGYLYFNGVLGGTNTVRSVDLYYIHGRWWNPDMGLFLSPNEKGDYLFGGDGPPGQDPANYGWATNSTPSVPTQRMPMPAPSLNNPNCDVTALNCTIEQMEQLSIDARVRWMHDFQIVYRTQGWFNNIEGILQSFQEKGLV